MSAEMIQESTESGVVINIPQQISHFKYVKTLAAGASSVVVLVEDVNQPGVVWAAKIVPRETLADITILQFFERELRVAQSLRHPNICRVEEVVYKPDIIVIIMEYCSNGDLLMYLAEHSFILPAVKRRMFYEICQTISYLHSRNIAHRDLKPENIFLDSELHIKLGDFGLSHETIEGKMLGTMCGTMYYSAPEVISESQYDGKKADVWSLGIILFCLHVLALPWTSTNQNEVRMQIMNAQITIPETVIAPVADIIRCCTRKDPRDRPSIDELIASKTWISGAVAQKRASVSQIKVCHTLVPQGIDKSYSTKQMASLVFKRPSKAIAIDKMRQRQLMVVPKMIMGKKSAVNFVNGVPSI